MKRYVAAVVAFCCVAGSLAATPAEASARSERATVIRWLDGDTVRTSAGVVRLIGVDTPERGVCGATAATRTSRRTAPPGSRVRLVDPRAVREEDDHGRLLRYVERDGVDVGLRLLEAGAWARYDGIDGYDAHPRQRAYRAADAATLDFCTAGGQPDLASYPPVRGTWDCPPYAPIKGNQGSPEWIYHLPSNEHYAETNPEECFASEAGAQTAGYRPARA